jgi:hypothetical protein
LLGLHLAINKQQKQPAASAPLIYLAFRFSHFHRLDSYFFSYFFLLFCFFSFPNFLPISPTFAQPIFSPAPCARIHSVISESRFSSSPINRSCAYLEQPPVCCSRACDDAFFLYPFSPFRPLTNRLFGTPLQLLFPLPIQGNARGAPGEFEPTPAHSPKSSFLSSHQ